MTSGKTKAGSSHFLGLISPQEVENLQRATKDGLRHPVAALAHFSYCVTKNTERAARYILGSNHKWLASLKRRLVDVSDFRNASSALGEIRAYGALLQAAIVVNPHPVVSGRRQSEFAADTGDGPVIVEVHSRQLDSHQSKALAENHKRLKAEHKLAVEDAKKAGETGAVTSSSVGVARFGMPERKKPGDSILTNAISRICGIKQSEAQIDQGKPFLLWLDFQDPLVWGYL